MNISNRLRSLYLFLIVLLYLAIAAIPLAMVSKSYSKRQSLIAGEQAAIEAIRGRGGFVLFRPFSQGDLPDVISLDLSSAVVDAELMQMLGQFTGIARLTLDGAKLQPEEYALLSKLARLQTLSLAGSNITDASISRLPLGLTNLSLKGTAVTDKSMSHLAAMNGLVSLTLTDTQITSAGLRLLEPLRSLKKLWVDDSCMTADSVDSLRLMQPQSVEVAVSEGMGQRSYQLLSLCKGSKIRGHHRNGAVLWEADFAWSDTLAGVVEAVVSETGLDSQQTARLLEALGEQEGWGATVPTPPPLPTGFSHDTRRPDRGIVFASVEAFIRELQKDFPDSDDWAISRFAKDKFTASDVPQLLAAIRASQDTSNSRLTWFGPLLLVQHGIDNPEVLAELDRLLVRGFWFKYHTVLVFGFGGAGPHDSREQSAASQAADAFAVPRLLRMCKDEDESKGIRHYASMVLAEIAHRRPEFVAEVIPVLVDLIDTAGPWHSSNVRHISRFEISRLAKLDKDAAIAEVPRLRQMLKKLDEQLAGATAASLADHKSPQFALQRRRFSVLEALSATAHQDPALAHETALDYLTRLEDGQPIGPFASLLSPDTPDANRKVVLALLGNANVDQGELGSLADEDGSYQIGTTVYPSLAQYELVCIAEQIRNWRTAKERKAP